MLTDVVLINQTVHQALGISVEWLCSTQSYDGDDRKTVDMNADHNLIEHKNLRDIISFIITEN